MKSLAVALNPGAVLDVLGGTAVDVTMVVTLGRIYGIEITMANARELVTSILKAAGWVMLGEAAVSYAASLFKGLTVGYGTVLTALPQGAAAGYGSYIVGQAARIYFEQGTAGANKAPSESCRGFSTIPTKSPCCSASKRRSRRRSRSIRTRERRRRPQRRHGTCWPAGSTRRGLSYLAPLFENHVTTAIAPHSAASPSTISCTPWCQVSDFSIAASAGCL